MRHAPAAGTESAVPVPGRGGAGWGREFGQLAIGRTLRTRRRAKKVVGKALLGSKFPLGTADRPVFARNCTRRDMVLKESSRGFRARYLINAARRSYSARRRCAF